MLRICDFNSFYSPKGGGIRHYHERKLEFFASRKDASYALIVLGDEDRLDRFGRARRYTIQGGRISQTSDYRWTANTAKLRRIFRAEMPHVIEVGAPYLSPWLVRLAARNIRARLVGFWHADYPSTYVSPALERLGETAAALGERLAWRYASLTFGAYDATFAASQHIVDELTKHGIGPVYRTPLGVDSTQYAPRASQPNPSDPSERSILYAGRLSAEKGVSVLCDAYRKLLKQHPALGLTIIGEGPLAPMIQRLEDIHTQVKWLGYVDDRDRIAELMAEADVVVTPGGHETFSLTTIEALSCGTPVVCADKGAACELVKASGVGSLFRAEDASDLARSIDSVLCLSAGQRSDARKKARQFVLNNHQWDAVLEHLLNCYQQVVGSATLWS